MHGEFAVSAAAGSLRDGMQPTAVFPHSWTTEGVAVQTHFTGAHLLHLATAACVLNDLYREAANSGLQLRGVRVGADGSFDPNDWRSTGITYQVQIDADATQDDVAALIRRVDEVAEIPRALRAGTSVERAGDPRRTH